MQFDDFSPPAVPTLDQQRDALQKGLGRAVQWATAGFLSTEPLLNACLHDQRFDRQCEDNRGEWLWKLISLTGSASEFRDPLLNALRTVNDEQNAYQLCDLALHFARSGDDGFRQQLYEFVGERRTPDSPYIGEGQLLSLDGEEAFLFIARLRGHNLATTDWEWHDGAVIDAAIEDLGESRVREILSQSLEPEIRRFATGWSENVRSPTNAASQQSTYRQRMQAITVGDLILAAQTEGQKHSLRGWGMHASESDLNLVVEQLWKEHDPTIIANLLQVFLRRPLPQFDSRLIDLCRHSDENVQRRAFNVLCENSHPLIRAFAIDQIQENTLGIPVVGLLIKNYEQGDEQRILDHVELPEDPCERHWMFIDLIKMLEENESADSSKLGQIIYFHNPCQMCRFSAARLLFRHGNVPTWLAEECRFDTEEECRTLAEQYPETSLEC